MSALPPRLEPETLVIKPGLTYRDVTEQVSSIPLTRARPGWYLVAGLAALGTMLLFLGITMLLARGVGVWGVNIPVAWGFAIVNFVWWIGIGHAGTLISAILLLLRQDWRTSINRFAEAMTIFAVMNAGLFPLMHLGRVWKFYYLLPYPNTMGNWPQWRSPLVWDVFAVLTYFTVSLVFWYIGLIPDLGTIRDKAKGRFARGLAGFFALGWRGAGRHWARYKVVYLILAGLATPLVVSVHSIVSMDFAVGLVPGWHSTIFPPYFVAGAIFSGFAMVLTIAIPLRIAYKLQDLVTAKHLDFMARVMLASGLVLDYGYIMEFYNIYLGGDGYEGFMLANRAYGPYWWSFWAMIVINIGITQSLWFKRVRRTPLLLLVVALAVNAGMWIERFVIVVTSLHRDFMPSAWGMYTPTKWDWAVLSGTICFFSLLMLLFIRFIPTISMSEVRELLHEKRLLGPGDRESTARREIVLPPQRLWGMAAEFADAEGLTEAARRCRKEGYSRFETYSPFGVDHVTEPLGMRKTLIPRIMLIGGMIGGAGGFFMQYYSAVFDFPWNVGGRPLNSWPSFIPLTFELTVLGAALSGVVGFLILCGLPKPYHPIFNVPGFLRASQDRFFLSVESVDPKFDLEDTRVFLEGLGPLRVSEVPE